MGHVLCPQVPRSFPTCFSQIGLVEGEKLAAAWPVVPATALISWMTLGGPRPVVGLLFSLVQLGRIILAPVLPQKDVVGLINQTGEKRV